MTENSGFERHHQGGAAPSAALWRPLASTRSLQRRECSKHDHDVTDCSCQALHHLYASSAADSSALQVPAALEIALGH